MINRGYFLYVKKSHKDGNGSYSWRHRTCWLKSWRPDPVGVLIQSLEDLDWPDFATGEVEIVAFNRI